MTAMDEPSAPNVPTTLVEGKQVTISWQEPFTGASGLAITKYEIQIKKKDGTYLSDLVNCDGKTSSAIVTAKKCQVPMALITQTTG